MIAKAGVGARGDKGCLVCSRAGSQASIIIGRFRLRGCGCVWVKANDQEAGDNSNPNRLRPPF